MNFEEAEIRLMAAYPELARAAARVQAETPEAPQAREAGDLVQVKKFHLINGCNGADILA